jgi:hypothetical protein
MGAGHISTVDVGSNLLLTKSATALGDFPQRRRRRFHFASDRSTAARIGTVTGRTIKAKQNLAFAN